MLKIKILSALFALCLISTVARAQTSSSLSAPLSNAEFVKLLNQLPSRPESLEALIAIIRERGIGFEITSGLQSLIATRSRNDATLRRTIDEALRRKTNPTASTLPPEAEAISLLERARTATLEAAKQMPDFVVQQKINRSYAYGTSSRNFIPSDRLTVLVTYREGLGERYKLMMKNDLPVPQDEGEKGDYSQERGTSSTGEFASILAGLFDDATKTKFKAVDTDTLRSHRTIVYEYEVKVENSRRTIRADTGGIGDYRNTQSTIVGYRGKVWIDRESFRVMRFESTATDIPPGFPVTSAQNIIDYEWTQIDARKYLLPLRAEVELASVSGNQPYQTRNEIRFRNYRKFGSKLEIIEDDEEAPAPSQP